MRDEPWSGRRNTRLAIVICAALCMVALLLFAFTGSVWLLSPDAPSPDPIAEGGKTAFDVAP